MHAIKGGWVGQTFALATRDHSGGRKSRIRRSKEERKAMVESFIKKYQNINNGNFPSLNLTHKEVGGSFYTVREIVREIIQENRVLGPAKLSQEEQNNDKLLEQFPLGSLSIDPQTFLSPLEESDSISRLVPNQYQGGNEEHLLNFNGQFCSSEDQRLELHRDEVLNGHVEAVKEDLKSDKPYITQVNSDHHQGTSTEQISESIDQFCQPEHQNLENVQMGDSSEATEGDEESDEPIFSPLPIEHHEINQENHQEANAEQVLHFADDFSGNGHLRSKSAQTADEISQVIEETIEFQEPIQKRAVVEDNLVEEEGRSKEMEESKSGITCSKAEVVVEKFPLRPVAKTIDGLEERLNEQSNIPSTLKGNGVEHDGKSFLQNSSGLMNVEVSADPAGSTFKKMSGIVHEKAVLDLGIASSEGGNCSTTKNTLVLEGNDVADLGAKVSSLVGKKNANASKGINHANLGGINTTVSHDQSNPEVTTASENKVNNVDEISSKKGSSSTLDRAKLETWGESSQKPAGSETNPLLALFKAFISAFVKFWTE